MYAVCPMPVLCHKHKGLKCWLFFFFLISSLCCCLNTAALQCSTEYIWFMFRRYYRWCVCHAGSCWRQNWAPSSLSTFRTSCSRKAWSYWGTKSASMKVDFKNIPALFPTRNTHALTYWRVTNPWIIPVRIIRILKDKHKRKKETGTPANGNQLRKRGVQGSESLTGMLRCY